MPTTSTLPRDIHSIALDSVVSRIQESEQRRRREEATQLALLAEALDQVSPDHFAQTRLGAGSRTSENGNRESRISGGANPEDIRVDAENIRVVAENANAGGWNSGSASTKAEILYRSLRAEIACALGLSERTIERRLAHAHELSRNYRETYRTLLDGQVGLAHTEIIVGAGNIIGLGDDASTVTRRASYEIAVLEHAVRETAARLRPIARRLAERFCEQTIDERHAQARLERRVWVVDQEDGMSDLTAHLPSAQAHAICDRLTRAGKLLRSAALDDGLTLDELRTDAFSELLLAVPNESTGAASAEEAQGSNSNIHAQIQVVITDETLFADQLRIADDGLDWGAPSSFYPAELVGSGPADTESARAFASSASHWELVRTHPKTGAVTTVDRYRPSEQMRRMLRARDLHCRFYGCRAPAYRCDIDHTIDAAKGGPTSTNNLSHLCRAHHTLKHHGGWSVSQSDDGVMHWRSPTGRGYTDRPPSRVRFTSAQTNVETFRLDPANNDARLTEPPF